MISITESAKTKFTELLNQNNASTVFFGVKSGGCSGFTYVLDLLHEVNEDDDVEIHDINGITFAIDGMSIMFIIGTEINWKEDIMGSCFEFKNPQEQNSCGCGTSFSV